MYKFFSQKLSGVINYGYSFFYSSIEQRIQAFIDNPNSNANILKSALIETSQNIQSNLKNSDMAEYGSSELFDASQVYFKKLNLKLPNNSKKSKQVLAELEKIAIKLVDKTSDIKLTNQQMGELMTTAKLCGSLLTVLKSLEENQSTEDTPQQIIL